MPDAELQFECPLCQGVFAIGAEWIGHEVECPHCGRGVTLGAAEPQGPEPAPAARGSTTDEARNDAVDDASKTPPIEPDQSPATESPATQAPSTQPSPKQPGAIQPKPAPLAETASEAPPERPPLTKAERATLRRRVNMVLAALGALVLVLVFVVLALIED